MQLYTPKVKAEERYLSDGHCGLSNPQGSSIQLSKANLLHSLQRMFWDVQLYRTVAETPRELNKTRGIGVIEAPPEFVASVIADDYESWDSTIKELKILKSERDPATDALVEVIWSRYCLRERPPLSCIPNIDRAQQPE